MFNYYWRYPTVSHAFHQFYLLIITSKVQEYLHGHVHLIAVKATWEMQAPIDRFFCFRQCLKILSATMATPHATFVISKWECVEGRAECHEGFFFAFLDCVQGKNICWNIFPKLLSFLVEGLSPSFCSYVVLWKLQISSRDTDKEIKWKKYHWRERHWQKWVKTTLLC